MAYYDIPPADGDFRRKTVYPSAKGGGGVAIQGRRYTSGTGKNDLQSVNKKLAKNEDI